MSQRAGQAHVPLWAGVVSGGFGTATTWWWDKLIVPEGDHYYPMFEAVARFVRRVPWHIGGFAPTGATISPAPVRVDGLDGRSRSLLGIKDAGDQW